MIRIIGCFGAILCAFIFPFGAAGITTSTVVPTISLSEDAGTSNPWTHLRLNNNPGNFQFAVVSDRTGGHRPGIFEDAIKKLNLLQPEFVMSVGDLIEGYTHDPAVIDRQWNEFVGFVRSLKMPFFFVPGNHDLANGMQVGKWRERFGREYYHFIYGDVLFLCVSSEDTFTGIGEEQRNYFQKALEENPHVRWTLAFLHRPLWVQNPIPAWNENETTTTPSRNGWPEFERLLTGRKYTVFAGHLHHYTKYERNDNKHIVLATTGGGSAMRGAANYGEFDHVVWVTMTDDGPIIANLQLSGIWDEDVRTSEVTHLVTLALRRAVDAERVYAELPFTTATARLKLTNDADIPLKVKIAARAHPIFALKPAALEAVVPPNSVEFRQMQLTSKSKIDSQVTAPVVLNAEMRYDLEGKPPVQAERTVQFGIEPGFPAPQIERAIVVDGDIGDWPDQWISDQPQQRLGRPAHFGGSKDLSLRMATAIHGDYLYVAAQVTDNKFIRRGPGKQKPGDSAEIFLDPRKVETQGIVFTPLTRKQKRRFVAKPLPREVLRLAIDPQMETATARLQPADKTSTATGQAAGRLNKTDYCVEAAFPIALLHQYQGKDWNTFRLNVSVTDYDDDRRNDRTVTWWRPDWTGPDNVPGSGFFRRRQPTTLEPLDDM